MEYAMYLNGVFEEGLREILGVQFTEPNRVCYLQPHGSNVIKRLLEERPSLANPVKIYMSTTTLLSHVSYSADIIDWRHKDHITDSELKTLNEHIRQYQPNEQSIYMEINGKKPANLIAIKGLTKHEVPFSVTTLKKIEDGNTLRVRTQAGNYSYVFPLDNVVQSENEIEVVKAQDLSVELQDGIEDSKNLTTKARKIRLKSAASTPEKVIVHTVGYRRNPDVVVEVLARANGLCEECYNPAPFKKRSDGTPYLEVHHRIMLSQGGDDTVNNAMAVCPNCHRRLHFG